MGNKDGRIWNKLSRGPGEEKGKWGIERKMYVLSPM